MLGSFGQRWTNAAVALLLAGSLAGCGRPTKTYSRTPFAAQAALTGTTIPGIAFGQSAHCAPGVGSSGRVVWTIEEGSDDEARAGELDTHHIIMKLSATLTAVAEGTEVAVDIQPPDGVDPAKIDDLERQQPAIARLWRSIASEQVDAALNRRGFDMANVRLAMATAVLAQLPQIGQQMDNAARENDRQQGERMDSAYRNDNHGG